jgi:hypothetical protein
MKALLALVCLAAAATAFPVLKSQTLNSNGVAIKAINEVAGAPSTTRLPTRVRLFTGSSLGNLARVRADLTHEEFRPFYHGTRTTPAQDFALEASIGLGVIPARNPARVRADLAHEEFRPFYHGTRTTPRIQVPPALPPTCLVARRPDCLSARPPALPPARPPARPPVRPSVRPPAHPPIGKSLGKSVRFVAVCD